MDGLNADSALSFERIRQSFANPVDGAPLSVIADLSFDVPRGTFVSVVGPSGCGKSTLLQMAAGLLKPTAGIVRHNNERVASINRSIGFVPQQAQLFPWKTMLENVEFPLLLRNVDAAERQFRIRDAIKKVDLTGFEKHYPHQLSGGMQKRASIARMLVYQPDTVLMDEPFGALDAQTRMIMQSDLQMMLAKDGPSVLFVTHDITEAVMLSDTIIVMSRRPATVIAEIPVNLPRPRNIFEPHATVGFAEVYDRIWSIFRDELKPEIAA